MYNGTMGEQGFLLLFFVVGGAVVGRAAAHSWKSLLPVMFWAMIFVGIPIIFQMTTEPRALMVSLPLFVASALLAYAWPQGKPVFPPLTIFGLLVGGLGLMGVAFALYVLGQGWAVRGGAIGVAVIGSLLIGLGLRRLGRWLNGEQERSREEGPFDV